MERYVITMGDFLKNAGIVGMEYLLETAGARRDVDYGITEDAQGLWLNRKFAEDAKWTDMAFKAFVEYFGSSTVYQGVMDRIGRCLDKITEGEWSPEKAEKEDLKFINDKLLSNSYQAGFENIKDKIKAPDVYLKLKKEKLSDKLPVEELQKRLSELQEFLKQPKCEETFIMKSVVYTYINRFWDGKCFLLRANAKKDMWELFEKDFSEPFRSYLKADHKKAKDLCIDCGEPINAKEKVSIAFMNEMGDDFTRKRSAFWNCKVDAFLCPACAFVYALSPLGFCLFADKFVFVNINNNINVLIAANSKSGKSSVDGEKKENERYSAWFARSINILLKEKLQEFSNVQVILRGTKDEDKYILSIINKRMLKTIGKPSVATVLQRFADSSKVKVGNEIPNLYESVIKNLLQQRNQYQLLNRVLRECIEDEFFKFYASCIYEIQLWYEIVDKAEKRKEIIMDCGIMKKNGSDLRKVIMQAKGTSSGDCLRGVEYQLLNALYVKNVDRFMDVVFRLYSSYGSRKNENGPELLIPTGIIEMLEDKEKFTTYGYAFVAGLIGCYEGKKENN